MKKVYEGGQIWFGEGGYKKIIAEKGVLCLLGGW